MVDITLLKKLRTETQVSLADCRKALEETDSDYEKAKEWLVKHGLEKAAKKLDRKTSAGVVDSYIHHTTTSGASVVLTSETDFVARTEEFKNLAHEIAKQVSAMNPSSIESLLDQPWIRDEKKTIGYLIKEYIAKLGENITIKEFKRFEV